MSHLPALFVLACVWSIGATCTSTGRARFDIRLRELVSGHPDIRPPDIVSPTAIAPVQSPLPHHRHRALVSSEFSSFNSAPSTPVAGFPFPLPSEGTVYDWGFDRRTAGWVGWMQWAAGNEAVPESGVKPSPAHSQADVFIPNKDSARYKFVMKTLITVRVLLYALLHRVW